VEKSVANASALFVCNTNNATLPGTPQSHVFTSHMVVIVHPSMPSLFNSRRTVVQTQITIVNREISGISAELSGIDLTNWGHWDTQAKCGCIPGKALWEHALAQNQGRGLHLLALYAMFRPHKSQQTEQEI
jgi:hypothetical protein